LLTDRTSAAHTIR